MGTVRIINYNNNAHSMVAAAGRISTTKGSAEEIYEKSYNNEAEQNIKLISKIMASGHESVTEHIFLNLAFDNVSVFVEQFMIEFRLASFTVKSRRYVDFGAMGYFTPDFTGSAESGLRETYQAHMQYLFDEYNYFIDKGIPKEDARFILPYSFKSNFYCTVNARELIKIMNEMVYGRGKKYPEIVRLGESLFEQCEETMPYLAVRNIWNNRDEKLKSYFHKNVDTSMKNSEELVSIVRGSDNAEEIICKAAALSYGVLDWTESVLTQEKQKDVITDILKQSRKRELEQVQYTISFNKISLAGITHLVRHRMQSIIIPEISNCSFDHYVLPDSIVNAGEVERYKSIFTRSSNVAKKLSECGMDINNQVYLMLSGMTLPILTTMNANELYTFLRLRTCNRAQWEIKDCADALLELLRKKSPVLFSLYGPTCYMTGKCPEGKMTCGQMKQICETYGNLNG